MNPDSIEILVLLSGGIDSAACLHFYHRLGRSTGCLFLNYGQPANVREEHPATAIARYYAVPLMVRRLTGCGPKTTGEIAGRNTFLVGTGLLERTPSVRGVALGIHAGTPYPDCSPRFVAAAQELATLQSVRVDILAPFLLWTKADVLTYCADEHVPVHLTYSCEAGDPSPCGRCSSCLDRGATDACA